jgi:N-formylglutamate amidohydrolase
LNIKCENFTPFSLFTVSLAQKHGSLKSLGNFWNHQGMSTVLTPRKFKAVTAFFPPAPYDEELPRVQTMPFVFSSPHSGRHYPERLLRLSRLDFDDLRRSEDFFVDLLFDYATEQGAPLLKAQYPRVYVDLNRMPYELDPHMFEDRLPPYAVKDSERVYSGFGVIPRVVAVDLDIYKTKMLFTREQNRIENIHKPYHRRLRDLLEKTRALFGWSVLVDCHSMPSNRSVSMVSLGRRFTSRQRQKEPFNPDIVLGDRHGSSCSPLLTEYLKDTFELLGYRVGLNNPYAGGYCTQHYGKPEKGVHAIQIEINRAIYMNEATLEPHMPTFLKLQEDLTTLMGGLSTLNLGTSRKLAAE